MALRPNARAFGRGAAGLGLALALAAGTALFTGTAAHAQTVTTGSVDFTGDPGDYISLGQPHSYSTAAQDQLNVTASEDHRSLNVSVWGAHGNWWYLDFKAPENSTLAVGTYTGATRAPFSGPTEPGLDITGDGRGCNTLTGSFTVTNAVFGPHGYVQAFDASYEQHCEGMAPALRGEIHIANPPAPAELGLGVGVAVTGTAGTLDGKATVQGTVTCNKAVPVSVSGQVTQVAHKTLIRGAYSTSVNCTPGAPVAWTAQADPTGTTPFQKGDVAVVANAGAVDPDYQVTVSDTKTVTVSLRKG
ncbi:hypothetical protein [Kitasatospora sp. CB02891]|uniref:hypothetical protein n=1 Tax=Kitasatospora sp. CB02891 TaxID=2020329 RepID=UPI000C273E60|nr:hypothetical protein [Kitasatospora sp. CB02891]PJN23958.1 hypothetical protein CG736_18805 [Kitasatospora sp. CB02891]